MKSITNILGIILIVLGVLGLVYGGFSYSKQENVAQIGDMKITASVDKEVPLRPIFAGLILVVGVVLVYISRNK